MSEREHSISLTTNFVVFAALLVLLVLTIAAAYVDMGPFGIVVAMAIAITKAVLILMYFMHVKFSSKLIWIFSTGAFFWLGILLVLGMGDYLSRGVLEVLGK